MLPLTTRFYYFVKPFVPWRLRIALRRLHARRVLKRCGDIWPIDPVAGRKPENWPGWPDGKQFAFVITHDVEGPVGLANVRPVAELEMSMGFRSCFNFIPEGPYRVPAELRRWLVDNGFEVGVHDLHHDGSLYRSRERFRRCAERINRYFVEWNAVGFRAAFMFSHLDWLGELNLMWDSSTFDTDPFEPKPDGVRTVFPFWVGPNTKDDRPKCINHGPVRRGTGDGEQEIGDRGQGTGGGVSEFRSFGVSGGQGSGYVELPCTLPQDSTLFLILRKETPEIWLRKLDWIAEHGGLALLNVHPDYIGGPNGGSQQCYPEQFYSRLLQYTQISYAGAFWHTTPNEIGRFVTGLRAKPGYRRPLRVCMVTHSVYVSDSRVIRYAEALAERGDEVDVMSLGTLSNVPFVQKLNGVNVINLQTRARKSEQSRMDYLLPLLRFFVRSSGWITRNHYRRSYDLLHIHNVPDFLVFAAWYPRLTGAKIILDIHDLLPEFYCSKFGRRDSSAGVRLLKLAEWVSARMADHVIVANHLWAERYARRTGREEKCSVLINYVDTRRFYSRPRNRKDGNVIILFPGGLQWHQGVDIVIRALPKILSEIPNAELHIYGDGMMKPQLVTLASELRLDGQIRFFDPVPLNDIAQVMANADVGVVPKRADSFGNEAYSTKIMEFMALRVPVVVADTRIDRYYFDESIVKFFRSGDVDSLAAAIVEVVKEHHKTADRVSRAAQYCADQAWEIRKHEYYRLVDFTCASKSRQ